MKKFILNIKSKIGFLGAIIIAATVGGLSVAAVQAAIPDSNGQINACYKNSTQILRVTDPFGNCASNETVLSWPQSGGATAYAHILAGGTLDRSLSKNINSVTEIYSSGAGVNQDVYCIDTTVPVKSLSVATEDYEDNSLVSLPSSQAWTNLTGNLCPLGADAAVTAGFNPDNSEYVTLF